MKSEIILNEIKNELRKNKKNQTIKTILIMVIAIVAVGSAAALLIIKFRNGIKDIIDIDELTSDDYNYEYDDDDDDIMYDFTDYDIRDYDDIDYDNE